MKRSPIKRKRSKPRRRAGACRAYLRWLREQPCLYTKYRTGDWALWWDGVPFQVVVDPAHVRTKRLGGDLGNAVSLAHHLHEELHQHGIKTFQAKYGVDLTELARRQTERFLELHPEWRPTEVSGF